MKHKRAPNGYHIELWLDGTYHAYHGGMCIDEFYDQQDAIDATWAHKASHLVPTSNLELTQLTDESEGER